MLKLVSNSSFLMSSKLDLAEIFDPQVSISPSRILSATSRFTHSSSLLFNALQLRQTGWSLLVADASLVVRDILTYTEQDGWMKGDEEII